MEKYLDIILLPSSIQDIIDEAIEESSKQAPEKIEDNSETIYSIVNYCLDKGWSNSDIKEYLHNSQYVSPNKYKTCADAKKALQAMNFLWHKNDKI